MQTRPSFFAFDLQHNQEPAEVLQTMPRRPYFDLIASGNETSSASGMKVINEWSAELPVAQGIVDKQFYISSYTRGMTCFMSKPEAESLTIDPPGAFWSLILGWYHREICLHQTATIWKSSSVLSLALLPVLLAPVTNPCFSVAAFHNNTIFQSSLYLAPLWVERLEVTMHTLPLDMVG